MKKSRINKDIYKYSKTLYGAERFKILLEGLKTSEKEGKDNIPRVDTMFQTKEEYEDYCRILVDFYIVNECIRSMLREMHYRYLASFLCLKGDYDLERLVLNMFSIIRDFFDVLSVIEDKNKKYGVDLLSYFNRREVGNCSEYLMDQKENISHFLEKTLSKKQLKEFNKQLDDMPRNKKKHVEDIFLVFHDLVER